MESVLLDLLPNYVLIVPAINHGIDLAAVRPLE
jgi:hypothetical protein